MIKCRLKVRMAEREISIAELCQMTGLNPNGISLLRNNKRSRIHFPVLDQLCQALDCQVGDILEYIPEDTQDKKPQKRGRKGRK